ncbi:unnamed protein product, partial [Mesorhabditis spiculigera]
MYLAAFSVFFVIYYTQVNAERALRSRRQYPMTHWPPSNATRTRSLSNTYATDGDPAVNDDIYILLTRTITQGFTTWKIKQFNDRIWLDRYRRSFWFGSRYYRLDNRYWLETRDTCAYSLDDYEKSQLHYEEPNPGHANTQIHEIFFHLKTPGNAMTSQAPDTVTGMKGQLSQSSKQRGDAEIRLRSASTKLLAEAKDTETPKSAELLHEMELREGLDQKMASLASVQFMQEKLQLHQKPAEKATLFLPQLADSQKKNAEEIEKQYERANQAVNDLTQDRALIEKQVQVKENQLKKVASEMHSSLSALVEKTTARIQAFTETWPDKLQQLDAVMAQKEEQVAELDRAIAGRMAERDTIQAGLRDCQEAIDTQEGTVVLLQESIIELEDIVANQDKELAAAEQLLQEKLQRRAELEAQKRDIQQAIADGQIALKEKDAEYEAKLAEKTAKEEELNAKLAEISAMRTEAVKAVKAAKNEVDEVRQNVEAQLLKLDEEKEAVMAENDPMKLDAFEEWNQYDVETLQKMLEEIQASREAAEKEHQAKEAEHQQMREEKKQLLEKQSMRQQEQNAIDARCTDQKDLLAKELEEERRLLEDCQQQNTKKTADLRHAQDRLDQKKKDLAVKIAKAAQEQDELNEKIRLAGAEGQPLQDLADATRMVDMENEVPNQWTPSQQSMAVPVEPVAPKRQTNRSAASQHNKSQKSVARDSESENENEVQHAPKTLPIGFLNNDGMKLTQPEPQFYDPLEETMETNYDATVDDPFETTDDSMRIDGRVPKNIFLNTVPTVDSRNTKTGPKPSTSEEPENSAEVDAASNQVIAPNWPSAINDTLETEDPDEEIEDIFA